MPETCVICLCNTNQSVCFTCNAKTHIKCFFKYTNKTQKSCCPACRSTNVIEKKNTRLSEEIQVITDLIEIHSFLDTDKRVKNVFRIFDSFIKRNGLYIYSKKMNNFLIEKLEMVYEYDPENTEKYCEKIFGVPFNKIHEKRRK